MIDINDNEIIEKETKIKLRTRTRTESFNSEIYCYNLNGQDGYLHFSIHMDKFGLNIVINDFKYDMLHEDTINLRNIQFEANYKYCKFLEYTKKGKYSTGDYRRLGIKIINNEWDNIVLENKYIHIYLGKWLLDNSILDIFKDIQIDNKKIEI
jgi:hypothetical protein